MKLFSSKVEWENAREKNLSTDRQVWHGLMKFTAESMS